MIFVTLLVGVMMTGCGRDPVDNLLLDTRFETLGGKRSSNWSVIQHTGELSYEWTAERGVLTARWLGPEIDGHIAQMIAAQGLKGETLKFSVELSGDLQELPDVPNELSGLQIEVRGMVAGVPRALGTGPLFTLAGSPPVSPGKFGWMVQHAVFEVPQEASAIRVSIGLGMKGVLRIRNPVLAVHSSSR